MMRNKANDLGYTLNEYGLFDKNNKRVNGLNTEKDIFNFLKIIYLDPSKRII